MGLLDQILGGAAGGASGQRPPLGRAGIGGSKGALIMALLPVVLRMLANRRRAAPAGTGAGMGAEVDGGFGGLPGGGGGTGGFGGMGGGLGGLLEQLSRRGFGQQAQSWVAAGPNEPLPREALDGVFGPQELSAIAKEVGADEEEVRDGLAEVLPEVVDKLTPNGQLPGQDELLNSIDEFERRLPQ